MKYLITALLMIFFFDGLSQLDSNLCPIEDINKLLQDATSVVRKTSTLRLTVNYGETPLQRTCYKHVYKRNGELKDSSLYSIINYNLNGTISNSSGVSRDGEFGFGSKYKYDKNAEDSIVTILSAGHSEKFYFNKKKQVYKYEISNDTNFRYIKQRHLYYYDEKGYYIKAEISFPGWSKSGSVSTYEWFYDADSLLAKNTIHGRLNRKIIFHKDSCCIEEVNERGSIPNNTKYYCDYNGNVCKRVEAYETKKGTEFSTVLYDRDNSGRLTSIQGDYVYEGIVNESYNYNSNGLLILSLIHISEPTRPY